MDLRDSIRTSLDFVLLKCFVLTTVLSFVQPIKVNGPPALNAVRGEDVTLPCTFTSSSGTTSRMSVDWSFTAQDGGKRQALFHFFLLPYPPSSGPFKDRVKWLGSPSRGEASIQLLNTSLADNGTYTCTVKNPPDTHGGPAQIQLTVTQKKVSIRLSEVMVLLLFILVPSAVIALGLLCRMFCPCCPPGGAAEAVVAKGHGYHSSIEVTERDMYDYKPPAPKPRTTTCCDLYFTDSEYEDDYHLPQPHHQKGGEVMVESQC